MKRKKLLEMVRAILPVEMRGTEAERCVRDVFRVRWWSGGEERRLGCDELSVAVETALLNDGDIEVVAVVDAEEIGDLLGEADGEFPERGRYRLRLLAKETATGTHPNQGLLTRQEFVTLSEAVDRLKAFSHWPEKHWLERYVLGDWVEVPPLKREEWQWVRDEGGTK